MSLQQSPNLHWDYKTSNNSWTTIGTYFILDSSTVTVDATVYAYCPSSDAAMSHRLTAVLRREGSADLVSVFSTVFDLLDTKKTLGAALWDTRLRLVDDIVYVDVKGASSVDVYWSHTGYIRSLLDVAAAP